MEFGVRAATHSILKEINNGRQHKNNLVLSPLSLHIGLNMLASAASGSTLEQLLRFLQCKDITELKAQSSRLMQIASTEGNPINLPDDYDSDEDEFLTGDAPLSVINGLWLGRSFSLKHSYKQMVCNDFKADVRSVDFQNQVEKVTDEINAWARAASKGCINPLFPPGFLKKDNVLVLANSIYFNGEWYDTFGESTTNEDFHLLSGETIKVPTMKRTVATCWCGSFEGFSLIKLPYVQGQYKNEYSMYVFLPDKNDGLPELAQKVHSDPGFLLEDRKLEMVVLEKVWLPKLKYGFDMKVKDTMIELGLDLPFRRSHANFREMVEDLDPEENIYVSEAIQKCYIDVNEKGTIATAITAYLPGLMGCSEYEYPKPTPKCFVADHPFLLIIKEENTGIVIFVGAALNPLSS